MNTKFRLGRSALLAILICVAGTIPIWSASGALAFEGRTEIGLASWYNQPGNIMSSGIRFDANSNMAAHKTLPIGSYAKVTNLANGISQVVRIADRGPFNGRIIDLTPSTSKKLGVGDRGVIHVSVTPISDPRTSAPDVVEVAEKPEPSRPAVRHRLVPPVTCAINLGAAMKRAGL